MINDKGLSGMTIILGVISKLLKPSGMAAGVKGRGLTPSSSNIFHISARDSPPTDDILSNMAAPPDDLND